MADGQSVDRRAGAAARSGSARILELGADVHEGGRGEMAASGAEGGVVAVVQSLGRLELEILMGVVPAAFGLPGVAVAVAVGRFDRRDLE